MCQALRCVLNIKDGPTEAVYSSRLASGKSGSQLRFKVAVAVMEFMGTKQGNVFLGFV